MAGHEHVICPRCHTGFECKSGSVLLCHCSQVTLSDEHKAFIAERWDGCLCHPCLLAVSNIKPGESARLE